MKKLIPLILLSALVGCATTDPMESWLQEDFDNFVLSFGAPTKSYEMKNGYSIHTYEEYIGVMRNCFGTEIRVNPLNQITYYERFRCD